jgi:prepilin-type N-terminal cleavage/methylation domain-containing protein
MTYQRKKSPAGESGFTIIETLIVLAIAGIILMIVFEAIPALQRSSRNGQRKTDVTAVLEAVSHYELNHSGNIPDSGSNFLQFSKLTYYNRTEAYGSDPSGGGIGVYVSAPGVPDHVDPLNSIEVVRVYNYQKCDRDVTGGSTSKGAGYSDIVALFALEGGNNTRIGQCQDL